MGFILFIHVVVCILLVISILMQAGRGGGLAESFASAESMFGTQTNAFMVRISTVLATLFIITSLVLAFYSTRKDKSLMTNDRLLPKAVQTKPNTTAPAKTTTPAAVKRPVKTEKLPVTGHPSEAEVKITPAPSVKAPQPAAPAAAKTPEPAKAETAK